MKKLPFILIALLLLLQSSAFAETKTYIKEYTYQASEDDSRNSSRVSAMREVKRLLLEELGTYLESVTEVQNFQLTKDQITALTAGIVKTEIVNEKWDGHTYWIKTKIVADEGDVIKSIDKLRQDHDKSNELGDVKIRSDAILSENKKLREELKLAKGEDKQKKIREYDNSINELSAIEWYESGVRYYEKGDYKAALDNFNKAIELNPKYAIAYISRGATYSNLDKHSEAIIDYSITIELNPKYAMASYYNRGLSYYELGKYNEAILDYNKVIELNPKYVDAYKNRAAGYFRLGNEDKSILDYSKAIELNPKDAYVYYIRAAIHSLLGHNENAIKDLSKAIEINPDLRKEAKTDISFLYIENTPDFKRMVGK